LPRTSLTWLELRLVDLAIIVYLVFINLGPEGDVVIFLRVLREGLLLLLFVKSVRVLLGWNTNDLLNLVLQDKTILLNEHALLHLGEDMSLVLAESILLVYQTLKDYKVRKALVGLLAGRRLRLGTN